MQRVDAAINDSGMQIRSVPADEPLSFGPVIVARLFQSTAAAQSVRHMAIPNSEFAAIYFPLNDGGSLVQDVHIAGSMVSPASFSVRDSILLLAPVRFLAGILPVGPIATRLPLSTGLNVLQRYLHGLMELDRSQLCHLQSGLAANAIRSLLAAALLPSKAERGLASRRRLSLLDRVVAHIDTNLLKPATAESLCLTLGCSRSALYRATAEVGGVEELILKRRLIAIRNSLQNQAEQRSIAQIADDHGFSDTTQFNRRFKALFGVPPSEIRRRAIEPDAVGRARDGFFPLATSAL